MFPTIRTSGAPYERGRQYGEQARERVLRSIAAYEGVFQHYAKWDWNTVRQQASRYADPIARFGPQYLEEMRGISAGAGVELEDVLAINVRTEVMYAAKVRSAGAQLPRTLECTAFAAVPTDGRPVLVGQNWDWKTHAVDTVVLLECEPDDGPRFVTAVEAGLLAKTGLNDRGLGVATNALASQLDRGEPGVPYHVLLRALLSAETPTAALALLQKDFRSSSAHYLVAHRDGLALGVEAEPGGFDALYLTDPDPRGVILHGNHFRHDRMDHVDVGLWLMPDSVFRVQRASRWLDDHDPFAAATYESLLADHAGHPLGICCHPDPTAIAAEQDATVLGLVMDLRASTIRFAAGLPCESGFETLDVSAFLDGSRA
jgi:isopenicillin-N N-acyltransferase like protein